MAARPRPFRPVTGARPAVGDGTHKLPIATAIRTATENQDSDGVRIHLGERLG